jgi:glycosyltransferase involved in cell wall biosynthesis
VDGLVASLRELLADPAALAAASGAAGRNAERFGWGRIAAELERVYRDS